MNNAQPGMNLTSKYPELGTGPISTGPYCDHGFFEKEVEGIFKKNWLWAIRENEIPEPGDYMVKDLPTLRRSVIIIRGRDNKLRAFENVCSHRGARVVVGEKGCAHRFTCPFHAWTYNTEGALVGVPDAGGYFDLERSKLGLPVVPCETWEGFVFVHPEDTPGESLEEYLGDWGAAMRGYPFANGCDSYQYQAVLNVNWKVAIDAFPETLHVPYLHKDSVKPTLAGPRNPFGHLVDFVAYGRHRTASVWGDKEYDAPMVQGLAYTHASGPTIVGGRYSGQTALPRGVNPAKSPNWSVDVNVVFPNFLVVISEGMYFIHQMWPLAANRTQYNLKGYYPAAKNGAQRFSQEYAMIELRNTILEDISTMEGIQRSFDSGMIQNLHFHDHEVALRHQYHIVTSLIGSNAGTKMASPGRKLSHT